MCIELRTNSIQSLKLRLKVFLAQSRSRQKNGQRLQCAAQVIDFVNILGAECARPETAPGIRTYQSFLNEPLQCLAHRCAAHSQLFRQSDIRKPLLLTPADHDNALPDLFVSVICNCTLLTVICSYRDRSHFCLSPSVSEAKLLIFLTVYCILYTEYSILTQF